MPSFGLTECASQVATAKHGSKDLHILPHVTIQIDDDGYICIKSTSLLTTYSTSDPKVDGWFKTEDKGHISENRLQVYGRSSDFVKIGGESVNLKRLEMMLPQDMILLTVPDERLGHVIHLVTTEKKSPVEELITDFNQRVLPFERIRKVHYVGEIPRSPLNKVMKNKLLERLMLG